MTYINSLSDDGSRETIDQFETRKEAKEMLIEYKMAFPSFILYLSQRCCKDWK